MEQEPAAGTRHNPQAETPALRDLPMPTHGFKPSAKTAQNLGALLESARDIMRKDKGLNGDLES